MDDALPQSVLSYETPNDHVPAFARRPEAIVILIGIVVPGLSSWVIRGRRGVLTCLALTGGLAVSFLTFGPFWGEVLFKGTRYSEWGLWPFLVTCAVLPTLGGLAAARDRRRALSGFGHP